MRTSLKTGALLGAVAMGVTVFAASPASAWVRVKTNGTWKSWLHNPSKATISNSTGNYQGSQHKGCETCTVYTL
ncbi:hypothetical protein ACPESV_12720 [Streptomyces umbrinus]|uniref:hypothetical protein n=1 Tax=Streptomyces umbrinus TaxID=67370 RepID=UPI003C2D0F9D